MGSRKRRYRALLALLALLALAAGPYVAAYAAAAKSAAAPAKKPARRPATAARTGPDCLGRALGGMENIARVSTLYARYQLEAGGVTRTSVLWRDVRGAVCESLYVADALPEIVVFDGARGWRRGTSGSVVPLSGAELADRVTDAYLGSYMHIVPGRIPGKVERVGLDRASGLVKLRVTPQGGTPATLFLDTLTCLPARIAHSTGGHTQTLHLGDWRTVSGIKLAYAMRRTTGDSTIARLTLLDARFDAPPPAGVFARPAPVVP
jgi:hypothetical protein